jgi:hypothetical protein
MPVPPAVRHQSEKFLANLKEGKAPRRLRRSIRRRRSRRPASGIEREGRWRSSGSRRRPLPCSTRFSARPGPRRRSSTLSTGRTASRESPRSGFCRSTSRSARISASFWTSHRSRVRSPRSSCRKVGPARDPPSGRHEARPSPYLPDHVSWTRPAVRTGQRAGFPSASGGSEGERLQWPPPNSTAPTVVYLIWMRRYSIWPRSPSRPMGPVSGSLNSASRTSPLQVQRAMPPLTTTSIWFQSCGLYFFKSL